MLVSPSRPLSSHLRRVTHFVGDTAEPRARHLLSRFCTWVHTIRSTLGSHLWRYGLALWDLWSSLEPLGLGTGGIARCPVRFRGPLLPDWADGFVSALHCSAFVTTLTNFLAPGGEPLEQSLDPIRTPRCSCSAFSALFEGLQRSASHS